jgi:hypothetical protein
VTPYIDDLLDGQAEFGVFPQLSSEKLIGRFSAGHLMTASRQKTKAKPDVEQIVGQDEVWALCSRTPKPGWRILGRFVDTGHFVALTAWDKNALFRNYDRASREVIEDWKSIFGDRRPFSSSEVGAYLGGVFRDVDEKP